MDDICGIVVQRAGAGCRVRWGEAFGGAPVDVHVAADPALLRDAPASVCGARDGAEIPVTSSITRPYFLLAPARGEPLVVAERSVPLERGVNFRDLGGYAGAEGRRVRWGRLFRSGHLSALTDADRDRVAALGIGVVCDLRMAEELANENAVLPDEPRVEVLGIPPGIRDPLFFHKLFDRAEGPGEIVQAMHHLIGALVREATLEYRRLFEVLLEGSPGALLINCSAGKERTGVGVALLLSALGVPRETVSWDFMLSREYFPAEAELDRVLEKYQVRRRPGDRDIVMPLLETRASYIGAAFDAVDEAHGSMDAFLREACGLGEKELTRLRELYLA